MYMVILYAEQCTEHMYYGYIICRAYVYVYAKHIYIYILLHAYVYGCLIPVYTLYHNKTHMVVITTQMVTSFTCAPYLVSSGSNCSLNTPN